MFDISLTSRVQLHIYLLNVVVRIIFFLNSENLIRRGTDISKCFRESLGIRDNESRLPFQQYFLLPPGFGRKNIFDKFYTG